MMAVHFRLSTSFMQELVCLARRGEGLLAGTTPKNRLRLSVVDRFLILRLSESKALLPEGDMAEAVTRTLASFAPSYSIICDFRGLEDFTSDVTELLERILETGATVLAPAPLEKGIRDPEEELPARVQRQLEVEEDRTDYLKHLGRIVKREIPVLQVRGDE